MPFEPNWALVIIDRARSGLPNTRLKLGGAVFVWRLPFVKSSSSRCSVSAFRQAAKLNSQRHHRGVMRTVGLVLFLLALGSRESRGQGSPYPAEMIATAALRPSAPPLSVAANGWHAELMPARRANRTQGKTLMIVGGAAIVAGILVGGDGGTVLILGGVGVGAYGLYLYQP